MKSRTFRLEESDIELLKLIADAKSSSQTDAIRFAIRVAYEEIQGNAKQDTKENGTNSNLTGACREDEKAAREEAGTDFLREQLRDKQSLIDRLLEQNSDLLKLVDQEQKLHLATKSSEATKAKTGGLMKRLFGRNG